MMKILSSLLILLLTASILSAGDSAKIENVNAKQAAALLAAKSPPVVLDVRTPSEFKDGHISGALSIDFKASDFKKNVSKLDRAQPYLLHCRSGARSSRALKVMRKLGFKHVYHLDSGIKAWEDAGQALVKGK